MMPNKSSSSSSSAMKKTGVWWDINTCQLPEDIKPYEARQIRQSIESTFSNHLPFIISAIGNLNHIPDDVFEPLLSTGIIMKHGLDGLTSITMDMYNWTDNNPPPATLIIISDHEEAFVESGMIPRLRDEGYTIIRAFQKHPADPPRYASQVTRWDYLLSVTTQNAKENVKDKCSETAWLCNLCIDSGYPFAGERFESWKKHLKTAEHRYQEWKRDFVSQSIKGQSEVLKQLSPTKKASSLKTGVWWDLNTCHLPEEFEPYQVRQSIESTFAEYSPFSISAIGNLNIISDDVLETILSTGFFTKHGLDGPKDILIDMERWAWNTPPPATLILISDHEQVFLESGFLPRLKDEGYTIIRAYSRFPDFKPEYASETLSWGFLLSAWYKLATEEVDKVKEKCSETAWFCNRCIESGHTFAGERFESLTRHFKTAEHSNFYQESDWNVKEY